MSETKTHLFRSAKARDRYLARYEQRAATWPVPSTEQWVSTSFGQTFVRVSGTAGAPPVLMLPGIGSPGLSFVRNVEALASHFAVYAIDNIHDNGRSMETRPVTSASDYVVWLEEVRIGLGLDAGLNLVGLSYGGWIFTQYALRHPERVAKLVQLAPAGTVAPIPWGFIWRALLCMIPLRFFMRMFMNWIRVTDMPDARATQTLDAMADDAWLAQRSFKARRMVAPLPLSDDDWRGLRVPTLLMAGDREVMFPAKECLARVGALAPTMKTELMVGTGHDFFVARADEVNRRVIEFLDPKA